jgi:two-component system, cell cycle response regulator DivK
MDMGQSGSRNEANGSTSIPIFDRHPQFFRYVREVFISRDFAVGWIAASKATAHRAKMAVLPPMRLSPRYEGSGWLPDFLGSDAGVVHLHFRPPEFFRSRCGQKNGAPEEDNTGLKRILIVEDNELHLRLLNDLLKVHGYKILKTEYGREAVKLARNNSPDLILMDIKLPDLSGFEVTRLLKQDDQTKCIPIIAVTAFALPEDERKAFDSGCDGYIAKPIMIQAFLRTVRNPPGKAAWRRLCS